MLVICLCYRQFMQPKSLYSLILTALLLLGAAGLWMINSPKPALEKPPATGDVLTTLDSQVAIRDGEQSIEQDTTRQSSDYAEISGLIDEAEFASAISEINKRYSNLSSVELDQLRRTLISTALMQAKSEKKSTLSLISQAFDDVLVWELLGDAALVDNDWRLAYRAQLRASELQNDPIRLENLLTKLSASSSHLRKSYEESDDLIGIKDLYQDLTDRHPSFSRFRYELAISMINLGEVEAAKPMLQALSYDLELGSLAQQTLDKLNSALADSQADKNTSTTTPPQAKARSNNLVVPLVKVGNSFMINSSIEQSSARLLLDTGASITSLSSTLIARLGLSDTGRSISLSTANGVTRAKLYRVKRLQLGPVVLRDMIVAEIGLSSQSSFQGLLGTDALNQLAPKYSYLIDNQKRALIFSLAE